jgi:hypothetical protein
MAINERERERERERARERENRVVRQNKADGLQEVG